MSAVDQPTLAIGIPTYRRTQDLARLLAALPPVIAGARDAGLIGAVEVVVIDNDRAESAREVVRRAPLPARYVVEEARGVVAVRNRALDEASQADLLVFIDDDETPADERWLVNLLATRRDHDATAVAGPVRTVTDEPLDSWIVAGGFFARAHRAGVATGTRIERAATNNLLLDLDFARREGLRFDPRFARTGGEDSLFTSQAHRSGARIIWCAEALVLDHLPPERRTRAHAAQRTRGMATAGVRVSLVLAASAAGRVRVRSKAMLAGIVRWIVGAARGVAGVLLRSERLDATGRKERARGRGSIEGALNRSHALYGGGGDR